jgi:RluA family pseudouridine synthase
MTVPEERGGARLDHVLAELLPAAVGEPVSRGKARKLILAGAVYLDRKRVRVASRSVHARGSIEVVFDPQKWEEGRASATLAPMDIGDDRVIYEDADLIVVDKPPGLPTQPTVDQARDHLFGAVKRRLGGPNSYVGLHHRLDVDTSGLVLFTKTKAANPGVARLFAEHALRKTYFALALRPREGARAEWTVKNHLGRLPGPKKPSRFGAVRAGGDVAETHFKRIQDFPDRGLVLVEARPVTGRTHQIRVHLSEGGMPILGDRLYGGDGGHGGGAGGYAGARPAGGPIPRLMLHAGRLEFKHPLTGKDMVIEAPLPADFRAALGG